MNYFKNAISKLYETVSAPVAATRDALAERLQSVRETAALLYEKTKEKLGYGQTLKDVVEEQAEQEHPEQEEENNDLTPEEYELAMNVAASDALAFKAYDGAMLLAAINGHLERVKLCKEWGATDYDGAMCWAAINGHLAIVKLCKEWGATEESMA